ncbi:acid phosphatase PHO11 [Sugiyamaella lignohabitans]|uniref:Acid phosphatase PHO11 n=1 Tax=Sugiyamaella lignohabitans TaxID=796027 RepID=A0A167C078_9ASCO|nr:acid phosphatase PHO11 [Sugiyamaella lignohabitans]ANB11052.1 acid phosphatase PHO11 [Sugiyamaella lignohabitans]
MTDHQSIENEEQSAFLARSSLDDGLDLDHELDHEFELDPSSTGSPYDEESSIETGDNGIAKVGSRNNASSLDTTGSSGASITKGRKPKVNFDLDETYVQYDEAYKGIKGRSKTTTNSKGNISRHFDYSSSVNPIPPSPTSHRRGNNRLSSRKSSKLTTKLIIMLVLPALVLFILFFAVSSSASNPPRNASPVVAPTGLTYPSGFNMKQNWGSASPYFDTGVSYTGIDSTKAFERSARCSLRQSHVLHRHAERYPTDGMTARLSATAEKLMKMPPPPSKQFEWISKWNYTLGADLLTARGVGTEFKSGSDYWGSHGVALYNATSNGNNELFYSPKLNVYENGTSRPVPVLRATTQSRIETSARAWAAGFFGVYGGQIYNVVENSHDGSKNNNGDGTGWNSPVKPDSPVNYVSDAGIYKLVLQAENHGNNNTLASYYACPNDNSDNIGKEKKYAWIDNYLAPAAVRLNKVFPDYGNMTAGEVYDLQNFCAFETAAYGSSRFCELFTESEWRGFEYAGDLSFYYDSSFGSPVGASMGAGYLVELLARLQNKSVIAELNKGVNLTLDNDPATFPLGQPFYLDMTHDSIIISVLTAIGFDFINKELPTDKLLAPRQFVASRLVPFGARLIFDILECDDSTSSDSPPDLNYYVRVSLNSRVLPLGSLHDCPQSEDGFCPLDKFASSLQRQISSIDFVKACYGK